MQWQVVRDVFVAALDVDERERDVFIERATTEHPQVAREVKRLLRLHHAAGGFLETDPARAATGDETLLAHDELVADRFAVRRLLGRGGMAEVYEAHDRVLGEPVALKVMRSTLRDAAMRAEQFRREVQLARRISHPGVCRVHDVAFHRRRDGQPLLVLTMEFLAGQTLAERLRQGPVARDEARAVTSAIATALQAAHSHGIVHGDIKPENVMLVRRSDGSTRVVLTDFGLAKGLGGVAQPLPASDLMGTPAYMAPELFRGAPPSIASDLYAFALLAYRLLSPRDDVWQTTRVLDYGSRAMVPHPRGLDELAPADKRALSKGMSFDPTDRFSSAVEFLHALFPETGVRNRHAVLLAVAALLVAVVLLTAGPFSRWLRVSRERAPMGDVPALLLVTATENLTKEPELDGLTELLRGQLAQSTRLDVLEPETVQQLLREMSQDPATSAGASVLREVALRARATRGQAASAPALVVSSRVRVARAGYSFDVRLEHVGAHPSLVEQEWQQQFAARDRQRLLDVARRASTWVRKTIGESNAELHEQDRLPSEITTGSWEALRAYAKAQESHARGDSPTAVVYLQEAVRLDPAFVSARAWLGEVLIQLRREREGYAELQRAVELADSRQLTTREALLLRLQYAEQMGTATDMEAAARAYALRYPNDFNATIYLGAALDDQGRTEEAIPWLEAAARARPASPTGHMFLAHRWIELGRLDAAAAVSERLRSSTAPDWATWMHALIAFTRGDLPAALGTLEALRDTSDRQWRSRYYTLHGSWLAEAGRGADAERALAEGIAFDLSNGIRERAALKWLHVAELRARADDPAASVAAIEKAIAVSSDARTLGIAGSLFARLGMVDEVRKVRDALGRLAPLGRARLALSRVNAELQRATGQPDVAARSLDEVVSAMRLTDYRDFYVDALVAAGREPDAIAVLSDWVRHPARFYVGPEPWSCAPWTTAIDEYLRLLLRQGGDREAMSWRARLLDFRGSQTATGGKR